MMGGMTDDVEKHLSTYTPPPAAEAPASAAPAREPIGFEVAKGCVAHYASVAATTIDTHFNELRKDKREADIEPEGQQELYRALMRMALKSYQAESPKAWGDAVQGGRMGSALIGSILLARNITTQMLKYANLPAGTESDACGELTRHGVEKLRNGLNFSLVGIRQHMPPGARYKASLHLALPSSGSKETTSSKIGTMLDACYGQRKLAGALLARGNDDLTP